MRTYEIKLTSPGFDSAVNNLTRMGTSLLRIEQRLSKIAQAGAGIDGLTKRIEKLADQMERLGGATAGVRASGGGGGGSRGGSRFISGPNQRLETIAAQMPQAVLQNNVAAVADLERAKRLAERSIALDQRRKDDPEHLSRPGLLELFSQMNNLLGKLSRGDVAGSIITLGRMSGRNVGGGVNIQQMGAYGLGSVMGAPSAGAAGGSSMASLAGLAKFAGPIGIAVTIAAATFGSIKKLGEVASRGAEALQQNADAAAASGATLAEIAGLRGMGFSAGAAGGLGSNLRSRLSSDPFAQAIGGFALPGHLTGQSNAPLLEAQMKRLRALKDEGHLLEMVRQERVLGLEAMHEELMTSKAMNKLRQNDSAAQKRLAQGQDERMADYRKSQERLKQGIDLIGQRMIQNWAAVATPVNNLLANIAHYFGSETWAGPGASRMSNSPVAQNTAAIEDLTKLLRSQFGGGPRAGGALSPAQKAAVMRGMDWDTARNLGAFRL